MLHDRIVYYSYHNIRKNCDDSSVKTTYVICYCNRIIINILGDDDWPCQDYVYDYVYINELVKCLTNAEFIKHIVSSNEVIDIIN